MMLLFSVPRFPRGISVTAIAVLLLVGQAQSKFFSGILEL